VIIPIPICYDHPLHGTASIDFFTPGLPSSSLMPASPAGRQARLFCSCGSDRIFCSGLCPTCYRRQAHSRLRFAGHREAVLERDGRRCRVCGAARQLAVHHRRPGVHRRRLLITLCAACHARVHRLGALRRWTEPALVALWREQHAETPLQLQFAWEAV
jgi:hypothetical protein